MDNENSKKDTSEITHVEVAKLRKVLQKFSDDIHDANRIIDKRRLGKILTIVDGSISDETQRKAIKDMVNESWYGAHHPMEVYPQARFVAEALEFDLYKETHLLAVPSNTETFNPYKELVK